MGDVLHGLAAVAALREALPHAHFGWVIEERWAELLTGADPTSRPVRSTSGRALVDTVHLVNTKSWRAAPFSDETWAEVSGALKLLRDARYEIAIDLQGAIKSALIGQLSGAATRIGAARPRERIATLFYSRTVETNSAHVIEQNIELASAAAGRRLEVTDFELPHDPAAETWCRAELARRGVTEFALLTPGAGWGAKCWPAIAYATVAREVAAMGLRSLINYGPGEEGLASEVEALSGGAAQKVLCSISELVALTRRAKLFVGGDTGPLHLAAALRIPVVGLFGPTDPARNGPYGTMGRVLRSERSTTSYRHHGAADPGLAAIGASEVVVAAKELLGNRIG